MVSLGEIFERKKGDERREIVRRAVGSGVKQVKGLWEGEKVVKVDSREDAHAAGTFPVHTRQWQDVKGSLLDLSCWE